MPQVLDDFNDATHWHAGASEQVRAEARRDAKGGLCLDYDFGAVSGYAVLRRELPLELPAHYAFGLRLHGSGPANALQVKFVDASGDNVWWMNRPGFVPPRASTDLKIRQRQIEFAWGPTADRVLRRAASIELVVASEHGGRGAICFERLTLTVLPAPGPRPPPIATASSTFAGDAPGRALDGDAHSAWRSLGGGAQRWQVDLGERREINGLFLRWADGERASDYDVLLSDDGRRWRIAREVRGSGRELLPLWLPEEEARYLRLVLRRGPAPRYGLAEVQVMGPAEWPTLNDALQTLALALPRGRLPRGFVREQSYWTVVGVDGGAAHAALLSEDGALEPKKAGPSLEPFIVDERGRVLSWAEATIEHSLRDGYLPLPRLRWRVADLTLDVEAGAEGTREQSRLIARYTLANTGTRARRLELLLALRPWQVNPPRQFLNTPGGVARVRRLAWHGNELRVDDRAWLHALTPPDAVVAGAFDRGDVLVDAAAQRPLVALEDPQALAGAALRWQIELAPGASRSIAIALPLAGDTAPPARADDDWARTRLDAVAAQWRERLNRVAFRLPKAAQPMVDTLRSSLAQILMSRDGPALQPGARAYARSWVRDGAMMVAGLLRLGEERAARDFVRWYAGHLFTSGKVPCCVDLRGADPVDENDSEGEFIYAVAELWRHTRDRALLRSLWPKVDAAARYMELLRQSERTPKNREPGREAFFGLMPASISHEGYSAKPMHSYWDDFWALTGYRDAADLAAEIGDKPRAAELARQRDEFATDLAASLARAMAQHGIDYLPGAAELGDFDPTSSTLIFSPAGAENRVPRAALEATWDRYWRESLARIEGKRDWDDYTPYEWRSVSSFVRLGQPQRAHALLDFFMRDRRPAQWNQWAEVVGRDPREVRFLGDMPHAWISSDFIRSALDLLAYERDSDHALVLAAGVPRDWLEEGVGVRGLSTRHGRLSYRLERDAAGVRLRVEAGLRALPEGGLWLAWPGSDALPQATIDGRPVRWHGRELPIASLPAEVRLTFP